MTTFVTFWFLMSLQAIPGGDVVGATHMVFQTQAECVEILEAAKPAVAVADGVAHICVPVPLAQKGT